MRISLLAAALAALSALQSQAPIRSGVELIRLDVIVVDSSGRPVTDLKPDDFSVRIDGGPRPVSFATYYGSQGRAAPPPPATAVSTFATNVTTTPGRAVVFVVDLESITPGNERLILGTASKLIDGLGPTDSAGLFAIPNKAVELTRDHARVKTTLASLRGASTQTFRRRTLTVAEAEAFDKRNTRVITEVIERECRAGEVNCSDEVANEARMLLVEANRRIMDVVNALATLNERLRLIDVPKSIVFISAGLGLPEEGRTRLRDLQRRSAEAGTQAYVVQVEQPDFDASRARPGGTVTRDDLQLGLTNIAGAMRGEFYAGIGTAAGVFERVRMEITNTYQLGVPSTPADADGRTHKIDVQVARRGLTVKARKELTISATPRPPMLVADMLAFPMPFSETPIVASAYTTQGDQPPALKVIVLVELLESARAEPVPSYAIAITNEKDEQVFATADKLSSSGPLGARDVAGVQLAPGQYRLRGAVIDSSGRRGSVDLPLTIGLRQAGPFQASDLLLGELTDKFEPRTHIPVGTPITALLELYAADPLLLNDAFVDLELRKSDEDALLGRGEATVSDTDSVRRKAAAGAIPTTGLAPGTYNVSAIVRNDAARVAIVSRRIVLKAPM